MKSLILLFMLMASVCYGQHKITKHPADTSNYANIFIPTNDSLFGGSITYAPVFFTHNTVFSLNGTKTWYVDDPSTTDWIYVIHFKRSQLRFINDSTAVYIPEVVKQVDTIWFQQQWKGTTTTNPARN
jgi:hypothetical protein